VTAILAEMGARGAAFALLLAGHVVGDFALQNDWMLENKHRPAGAATHALVMFAAHAVLFGPFLTGPVLVLLAILAALHGLVDLTKRRLAPRADGSLGLFAGDQLVHLLLLLVAWAFVPEAALADSWLIGAIEGLPRQAFAPVTTAAIGLSAVVFNHHGGNAIVAGLLKTLDAPNEDADDLEAGRIVGTLERWLVLVLVAYAQWAAIALVVTAKSIARFDRLDERPFAEHYLVGTLASVLVAIVTALVARALV
jgi:hypothetical protein